MIASALLLGMAVATQPSLPIPEIPDRHRPIVTYGRDCWRVLTKSHEYGGPGPEGQTDNPEVQAHHAITDFAPVYVAFAKPPEQDSQYTTWPRLVQNFRKGSPDVEIIETNPQPDRPFFIENWTERNGKVFWGSEPTLDQADYDAWRAKHPNLMFNNSLGEWCNDIALAMGLLSGQSRGTTSESFRSEKLKASFCKFFNRPADRYGEYDLLKRYFAMRKARNYGDRVGVLDAHLNTLHIAGDFGASFFAIETTGSGNYRYQVASMFTRGASRQFDIPWKWFIAGYVNAFAKDGEYLGAMCRYPNSDGMKPPYIRGNIRVSNGEHWPNHHLRMGLGAPDYGISRSVFRRTHYYAYLSGANFIQLEEWRDVLKAWDFERKKTVWSPRGKIYCAFADFVRDHRDRGAHYSPVALCVPIAQGYAMWGGWPFCKPNYGYTDGDRAIDAVVFSLFPQEEEYIAAQRKGRELYLHNSQFADMYDVIAPDAKSQSVDQIVAVMKTYKALVVAGDYPDPKCEEALKRYAAAGGRVVRIGANELKEQVGKGEITKAEVRYPQVERILAGLQKDYFPFEVKGSCQYGLSVAKDHVWLYVINNDGVTKYADTVDETDPSRASTVTVSCPVGADRRPARLDVVELLSGKPVPVANGAFSWTVGPGDLAVFEIK